jgi:hypothetical protein
MNRIKQQRPGYYAALRQNRKIVNKRINKLDQEIDLLTGQKNKHHKSTETINSIIKNVKEAGLWKRLKYMFSGNVKTLVKAS